MHTPHHRSFARSCTSVVLVVALLAGLGLGATAGTATTAAAPPPTPTDPEGWWQRYLDDTVRFTTIDGATSGVCGIIPSGEARCWSDKGSTVDQEAPGRFVDVSVGGDSGSAFACGVRDDGTLACWGDELGSGRTIPPDGSFTDVSAGGDHACAVRDDGSIACWGSADGGRLGAPTGTFTTVEVGLFHYSCALRTDATPQCWGELFGLPEDPPPAEPLTRLAVGGVEACGIRADGTVTCWGWADAPAPLGGTFVDVTLSDGRTCGVATTGDLRCWGLNRTFLPEGGPFVAATLASQSLCALRSDGAVSCSGNFFAGAPTDDRILDGTRAFTDRVADVVGRLQQRNGVLEAANGDLAVENGGLTNELAAVTAERDAAVSAPGCDLRYPSANGSTVLRTRPRTLSGVADDDQGVAAVEVSIQLQATGAYLDAADVLTSVETWLSATLATPGAPDTTWGRMFLPRVAGNYVVRCRVRDVAGNPSIRADQAVLTVQ